MNDGFKIEGYGLKAKRAQRMWKDVRRLAGVSFKYGIKTLKTETLSVAEVEKEMKAAKIPHEEIEEFMKANVVSVSSGTTLAKTEDDYAERDLESLFGEL